MRLAQSLLFLSLLASPALADAPPNRFAGTPASVTPGDPIPVQFSDPTKQPGTVITVTAHNSSQPDNKEPFTITLGPGGVGATDFPVPPGWTLVILQNSTSQDYSVWVGN